MGNAVDESQLLPGSLRVTEPATVVTDYLIAMACAFFAVSLAARGAPYEWVAGFALGGTSAVLGGTYHGFRERLSDRAATTLWLCTLLSFGVSSAAFGAGAVRIARPELHHLTVHLSALTAAGIYAVAALQRPQFGTAGRMALLMLATFLAMALSLAAAGNLKAASFAFACVILNVAGVVVQMRNLSPHPRFNHNDLFHVFQLAALWCLYATVGAVV